MAMFESLSDKLQSIFKELRRHGKLNEAAVDEAMREIRLALLEADVHYGVVKSFVQRVRERAVGAEVQRSLTPGQQVVKIVHQELVRTLGQAGRLDLSGNTPHVIMLVGLQGSGKTTTAAKLALHLRRQNHRPLLIAADTYRPAAIDQLVTLGRQLDIPVYREGSDSTPPNIAYNGVEKATRENASVVIIDTAGRLQIDTEMMAELASIRDRVKPKETLLVADSMTGQEAVNIARGFNEQVGLTGLILTKVDGDARGGAAISMREVTGVPIKFLGTSEKLDGLEVFHPDRLAGRILRDGEACPAARPGAPGRRGAAGARYLGEFAIGTNDGIQQFTRNILFDEKMGGTVHMAVGASYPDTGGKNDSAVHWDMICDMRSGGEVIVDGVLFYKDGSFVV